MAANDVVHALEIFSEWAVFTLAVLVAGLVVIGMLNSIVVIVRTLRSREALAEEKAEDGPLPRGFISMYVYLHLLADVLLVVVAIELLDTLIAFAERADPVVYLNGVIGAALVALARRIIVFFNPESGEAQTGEMYAYAALVVALAAAYAVIGYVG